MHVKIHLNKLLLKNKFQISHGSYHFRDQLLVELQYNGFCGYGETVAIDYYNIYIDDLHAEANSILENVEKIPFGSSTTEFYQRLITLLPNSPFLRCAFDEAFIDLKSRTDGLSIRDYMNIEDSKETISSITIGLADTESQLLEKLNERWPFYKVKINNEDLREEVLLKICQKNLKFGLDGNGGLDCLQAKNIIDYATNLGAEYFEQLIDKSYLSEIDDVKSSSTVPQFADESVTDLETLKNLSPFYEGFVLKLTKCGGITPVVEMIKYCKEHDKLILAGCMTESSIGINHMLQLLPLFDFADLDGAYLISNDKEVCSIDTRKKRLLADDGKFY